MGRPRRAIDAIAVVVPAHDEAALLPRCLDHLEVALATAARARPRLTVTVTIALDRCGDASGSLVAAAVARGFGGGALRSIAVDAGSAGRARAMGVEAALGASALRRIARRDASRVWIANTDADSAVPPGWVLQHADAADAGADVLVGAVTPDQADLDHPVLDAWRARHRFAGPHGHVFGANLGCRLDVYRCTGGFAHTRSGEDRGLVAAARAAGHRVVSTGDAPVLTSGRTHPRASGGFGDYLARLASGHDLAMGR